MPTRSERERLLLPSRDRRATDARDNAPGLPTDLLGQTASRLRILALLYAFVFFMAGFFPMFFFPEDRAQLFGDVVMWAPGVTAIAIAVAVAILARSRALSPRAVTLVGLGFQVASSYGIAAAEFLHPGRFSSEVWFGLSWVAVWALLFTVVVPARPYQALMATVASVSAVPVVVTVSLRVFPGPFEPSAGQFFFGLILPYLLVVVMAWVGGRVVYSLGTEVTRARELGSYRLVERLGQGGMGEVWKAEHRLLARPAAIKLIRSPGTTGVPDAMADEARHRFEREAHAIARLRSPHTVDLFDFGIARDGAFYYVMELLDGLDADALVRRFGPCASSGLSLALRGGLVRPRPPRYQTGQHLPLPLRRGLRLRQGSRFRHRQSYA